jgi:DNA polymerase-3 subunit epsilon
LPALPTPVPTPVQTTIDELGTPLHDITFVVVDLETTGGSPANSAITEIGAVKVRGGEVLGEFHTLVNPGTPIPPFIAVLTGITDTMVAASPRIASVLPAFLEFARDTVLVAHNAPFDVGFLKAATASLGLIWPGFDSVDTARLARRVLTRDEAPNCKLGTLAQVLHATVQPSHRALDDARATVEVLHVLFERLAGFGVHSFDELRTFTGQVTPQQRRKRHLADGLPHLPGVYLFRDQHGRVLYVGKSKDLKTRVRSYFTSSEMRQRVVEMVAIAHDVIPIVCATPLEAEVRELRLIAAHKPPYNKRSKFPERSVWVKLTVEPLPRLSIVREVRNDGAAYLGPFSSKRSAESAVEAMHEAVPLRQCRTRLNPRRPATACALAEIGKCGAPCDGSQSPADYALLAAAVRTAIEHDARSLVKTLMKRIDTLAGVQRYEDAAAARDRLAAFVRAAARGQRLKALANCEQLVAAKATHEGGYEVVVVRHGQLATAGTIPHGAAPRPYVDAMIATAATVTAEPGTDMSASPVAHASAEEIECVLRWLESPGTRLVEVAGTWCCPAYGAGGQRALLDLAIEAIDDADRFGDRRGLRPVHQPAREVLRAAAG